MRYLSIVLFVLLFGFQTAVSGGLTDVEEGLIEIFIIEMQHKAVDIEMKLHFAVMDSTTSIVPAALEAVETLTRIRDALLDYTVPEELSDVKASFMDVIEMSIRGYGFTAEEREDVDFELENDLRNECFYEYWDNVDMCVEQTSSFTRHEGEEEFSYPEYEIGLFENEQDREQLEQANTLITDRRYLPAGRILQDLLEKYEGDIQEGSIITKIADCVELGRVPFPAVLEEIGDEEYLIGLLDDFIKTGTYSPRLAWMYFQWRTLRQFYIVGVSNYGDIPNDEYLEVLREVMGTIGQYISEHPGDVHAEDQILSLLLIPLIERWGDRSTRMGNSVWSDYNYLWPF